MWLYSFCDILNYIFTQIFIIDILVILSLKIDNRNDRKHDEKLIYR